MNKPAWIFLIIIAVMIPLIPISNGENTYAPIITMVPDTIDQISYEFALITKPLIETKLGQMFLLLTLFGPLTFIPQIKQAWTAPNIDALRTWTWPAMTITNSSSLLGLVHNGDWRLRLVMFVWFLCGLAIWSAVLIRKPRKKTN